MTGAVGLAAVRDPEEPNLWGLLVADFSAGPSEEQRGRGRPQWGHLKVRGAAEPKGEVQVNCRMYSSF